MGTVSERQMGGSLWLLVGAVAQCHESGCLKVVNSGGFNAMQANKPVCGRFPPEETWVTSLLTLACRWKGPSVMVAMFQPGECLRKSQFPRSVALSHSWCCSPATAPSSEVWPTSDCILEPQPMQNWRPLWYCPHRGVCEWVPSLG